ncbi:hypothetical protein YC2023_092281 [Brassica napus]
MTSTIPNIPHMLFSPFDPSVCIATLQLRMVAISSDNQNRCEGPNQRQAFIFTAQICTSRKSNPGLYRGRVLFYH